MAETRTGFFIGGPLHGQELEIGPASVYVVQEPVDLEAATVYPHFKELYYHPKKYLLWGRVFVFWTVGVALPPTEADLAEVLLSDLAKKHSRVHYDRP